MLEGMVELNKFLVDDQVTKTNRLRGITERIFSLMNLIILITLKMGDLVTHYSLIM